MASEPTLKPLNVSPRLHETVKIIAALSGKGISETADELLLPVAERRKISLIADAASKNEKASK